MKKIFTVLMLLVFQIGILQAQISGTEAYILGNGVQIGISGEGGFEGADTTKGTMPAGTHFRSNTQYFGIVANPQNNNWATFDGDFFSPGTPENGWGISLGTSASDASNNCTQVFDMPGSITNYSVNHGNINVNWEGTDAVGGTNLDIKINFLLKETDLYYNTTVSITNNTSDTIPELYYYRNIDPDNNIMLNSIYATVNTVVSQPGTGGHEIAQVSATQSSPWDSYMALSATGANWRASYGGFSNRDGSNIWNGSGFTQTVGSSDSADIAIQLSYLIQNLAPGATSTFNFNTIFSTSVTFDTLLYFMFPGTSQAPIIACSTCYDTVSTCGGTVPIVIAGSVADAYSWVWSPAAGLSATIGDTVIASPSVTTMYTVIGTPFDTTSIPDTLYIAVKVTPGITAGISVSANPICEYSSLTLTASGGNSYLWNGSLGTSNPLTLNPTTTSTYAVTVTDINGCTASESTSVTVNPVPIAEAGANQTVCIGGTTSLVASGGANYQWNNGIMQGIPFTVNSTTIYTVTVTGTNSCTSSASVTIDAYPLSINVNTPAPTCGTAVTLNSTNNYAGSGTLTYSWLPTNGLSASNVASPIADPSSTTMYSVTLTSSEGCTATTSLTVTVDTAAIPVITQSGSILYSTAGTSYQWYLNGNQISGATGQFYAPLSPGAYSVTVTYANGCSASSKVLNYTAINELSNSFYISIFPNPTYDNIIIEDNFYVKNQIISIYDIQGQLLLQQPMLQVKTNINISTFSNGIYFLKVETEKGVVVKKFVKD